MLHAHKHGGMLHAHKHGEDADEAVELVPGTQRGAEEEDGAEGAEPAGGGLMEKLLQGGGGGGEAGDEEAAARPPDPDGRAPLEVHEAAEWLRRALGRGGLGDGLVDWLTPWLFWARGGMQNRNLLGTWCFIFCVFSARIVLTPLWDMPFVPILSPVFGHGPRWASSPVLSGAILAHVVCGVAMLVCATLQLDVHVRKSSAALHRTLGYLYVVFGIGCLTGLQFLKEGLTHQHGIFATFLIELTAVLWAAFTALAVRCARRRDFDAHKRWMLRSLAAGLSPLVQRGANYALVAVALTIRFVASALYGVSCFAARWPVREASAWDFVTGPGATAGSIAEIKRQHKDEAEAARLIDERFPRVLSWTGYGVAEAFVAPLSSLAGIVIVLLACELQTNGSISKATSLGVLREVVHNKAWNELKGFAVDFWLVFAGDKTRFVPGFLPARRALAAAIHVGMPVVCLPFFLLGVCLVAAVTLVTIVVVAVCFVVVMWFFENLIALIVSIPIYLVSIALRLISGESLASVAQTELALPSVAIAQVTQHR